jgi:OmpA-OmpF porin, OOP family
MNKSRNRITATAMAMTALVALAASAGAQAQTASANSSTNAYALTGVPKIYFDLSAGQTDYRLGNGSGLFGSNNGSTAYAISAGSYFTNNLGVELGYTDFGRINRGGGETRADGVTLKLVGRLPLGSQFNLLGKVGTTYGRTEVTSAAGSGISPGSDNGFGVNLGIGAEFLFTPNWSAVVQYDAHDLRFASSTNDRDRIGIATVGIRYTY